MRELLPILFRVRIEPAVQHPSTQDVLGDLLGLFQGLALCHTEDLLGDPTLTGIQTVPHVQERDMGLQGQRQLGTPSVHPVHGRQACRMIDQQFMEDHSVLLCVVFIAHFCTL